MKTIGNILWHIPFLGFVNAILTYLIGLLLTATVILSPLGMGLMEYGKFLFAPFGRAMVSKSDLNIEQNKLWKAYSVIFMILYFPIGLVVFVVSAVQAVTLLVSIVGIPVGLVVIKSLGTALNPINKKCVHQAVRDELDRRKAQGHIDKHLGAQN